MSIAVKKRSSVLTKIIKVLLIIGIIIGILVFLLLGFSGLIEIDMGKDHQKKTYQQIDYTEMTQEQRLEDFEYMWGTLDTSLLYLLDMKDTYGYTVLDQKELYRDAVLECETDMDFYAVISALLYDVPGCHLGTVFPDYYDYTSAGWYRLSPILSGTENLHGKVDALQAYFDESAEIADNMGISVDDMDMLRVDYFDGDYMLIPKSGLDYPIGVIKTVGGISAGDYFTRPLNYWGKMHYDSVNEKPFRVFSVIAVPGEESEYSGDYIDVVIETADGSEQIIKAADLSLSEKQILFYSLVSGPKEDEPDEERTEGELESTGRMDDIQIYCDDDRDLAYIYLASCSFSDEQNEQISEMLREATKYTNYIIDLRDNGGGFTTFWPDTVYPSLFSGNYEEEMTFITPENDRTDGFNPGWFDGRLSDLIQNLTITRNIQSDLFPDGLNPSYRMISEKSSLKASDENGKHNAVFLVSQNTASSADVISRAVKETKLGTVIGTNTMGEGYCVSIDVLPNSCFEYRFCPNYQTSGDGSQTSLSGTVPDILISNDADDIFKREAIKRADPDVKNCEKTIEARIEWDDVFKAALDELDSLS